MAPVHRTLTLLPLLGLSFLPFAASAAKLQVIGDSGNVASTIDLQTARYDVTQKKVVVTTFAGNTVCPQGQAPATGQIGLVVDGSAYGVLDNPPGAQDQPVQYAPAGGEISLGVTGAAACKSSNITTAGLKLAFDTGTPLTIGESVYFDTASRTFRIRVVEPVLCNSYAAAGTGLSVALTEANGFTETLSGFDRFDYELNASILRARSGVQSTGGRLVQCFSFLNQTVAEAPGSGDSIFNARFEFEDVQADVVVSTTPAQVTLLAGGAQAFQYTLVLQNIGNGDATGVRAREYLPSVSPGTSITAGAWSCARYAGGNPTNLGCTVASGSGVLDQPALSILPGERIEFTLNRSVTGGTVGSTLFLGGAAFVSPSPVGANGRPERDYSDNSSRFAVSLVGNQPPQVLPPLAMSTTEDGAPITIIYSATDPEGDAISLPVITSSDPNLFVSPLIATAGPGPGQWTTVLTPASNRNGGATISASFTDGNSQPIVVTSSVTVTAVNDAPSFTLSSTTLNVPACSPGPTCDFVVEDFVTQLSAGPSDEASQAVEAVRSPAGRITCSQPGPSGFFGGASAPLLPQAGANYRLVAEGVGVSGTATCEITIRETADNSSSTTQSFTITYP